jgi:hypothetical protein
LFDFNNKIGLQNYKNFTTQTSFNAINKLG